MITSKDNPRVKRWASLVHDARARRKERRAIAEGPHLVARVKALCLLVSESGLARQEIRSLVGKREPVVLADKVFRAIVDAETPPGLAAEFEIPTVPRDVAAPAVFLEGVQDPGNVGAILRSAAAFGLRAAVLDRVCADPWSPKVLRAGMGGHFQLHIHQAENLEAELQRYRASVMCTVPRDGTMLPELDFSGPVGWLFGAEGEGVSAALQAKAALKVTIPMAPGTESLNVAAAAAICFYAAYRPS